MLILRLAVSAGLIAWLLRRTDFAEVMAAFRRADLRLIGLALLLIPLGYLASVSRWRLLLRSQGGDAPYSFLVQSLMTGIFFNNLLPSTIGGDAVRAWDTSRAGVSRATAVAIVVVDRFVGLLALVLFAAVGLLVSGRLTERIPELTAWVFGGAAVLAALAGLLFLPSRRAATLGRRLPEKVSAALFAFQGKGRALAGAFAWSLVLQGLVVVNVWVLARALRVPIPLPYFFLIMPVALFAMMVPISINGVGVRESTYAFFFAAFGVGAAAGVAVGWLDYGLLLLQALAGGVVYAWGRRRGNAVAADAAKAAP